MITGVFFLCLSLSLYSAGSSLNCRWMDHKFRQYSQESLDLLDVMANNSTNTTEDAEEDQVAFPDHLYNQAFKASAEDKLAFIVQILREAADLFKEDYSSASWEDNTVDNFVHAVTKQADGLHSCTGSHKHKKITKLHMYFKRLSDHVLKRMGHSAEAWELIRSEIEAHLMMVDQLVSPLLTTN